MKAHKHSPELTTTKAFPYVQAVVVLVIGLAGRLCLLDMASQHSYLPDHIMNVGWGATAAQHGLLNIYNARPQDMAQLPAEVYHDGVRRSVPAGQGAYHLPNHPPLTMAAYALEARTLSLIDGEMTANTFSARAVMAAVPIAFDMVTAVAGMLLGWQLFGRRAGLIAGAALFLLPPVALNSAFWGQVDSMFVAPALLMFLFMVRRQWLVAGLCLGAAILLKAQAMLLGPVVVFAAIVLEQRQVRPSLAMIAKRLATVGAAAVGTAFVLSLPWTIAGGSSWIVKCYVEPLSEYPRTTLMAFNVWYLDLLQLDMTFGPRAADDSSAEMLGISKDLLGRLLVMAAMAMTAFFVWRKYRRQDVAVVIFGGLWLWATFIWPTRVHERYIIYAVAPMIVLAAGMRKYWPAVLVLVLVSSAEHTWSAWQDDGAFAGRFDNPALMQISYENTMLQADARNISRPTEEQFRAAYRQTAQEARKRLAGWEWCLTVLSLLAYAEAIRATFSGRAQSADRLRGKLTAGSPRKGAT